MPRDRRMMTEEDFLAEVALHPDIWKVHYIPEGTCEEMKRMLGEAYAVNGHASAMVKSKRFGRQTYYLVFFDVPCKENRNYTDVHNAKDSIFHQRDERDQWLAEDKIDIIKIFLTSVWLWIKRRGKLAYVLFGGLAAAVGDIVTGLRGIQFIVELIKKY